MELLRLYVFRSRYLATAFIIVPLPKYGFRSISIQSLNFARICCFICWQLSYTYSAMLILHFLPSPRRYSSGWALASWITCLHSSLFFINPPHPFTFILRRAIHPSEADCLVSEQFSFYGARLLASRPTSNLEDQDIPLRLAPTRWPVRHGWPYQ
jgi:hypothetical protein